MSNNQFITLEGEFNYFRFQEPELSPFGKPGEEKYQWKVMFRPQSESLMKVMDLQSLGVKNQLKKDEKGYYINFSRPTKIKTSKGAISLEPPKVFKADGTTPLTDLVGNGSKGSLTIELYEHKTPNGGKAHAARIYSATVTELVPYEGGTKAGNGGF